MPTPTYSTAELSLNTTTFTLQVSYLDDKGKPIPSNQKFSLGKDVSHFISIHFNPTRSLWGNETETKTKTIKKGNLADLYTDTHVQDGHTESSLLAIIKAININTNNPTKTKQLKTNLINLLFEIIDNLDKIMNGWVCEVFSIFNNNVYIHIHYIHDT